MTDPHPRRLTREQAQAVARELKRQKREARREDAVRKRREQEGNGPKR